MCYACADEYGHNFLYVCVRACVRALVHPCVCVMHVRDEYVRGVMYVRACVRACACVCVFV